MPTPMVTTSLRKAMRYSYISRADLLRLVAAMLLGTAGKNKALAQDSSGAHQEARRATLSRLAGTAFQKGLEAEIARVREKHGVPALYAGVWAQGRILGLACNGLSDLETKTPAKLTDKLMIGSVSKPLTATLIGVLVEKGFLRWDTRVRDVWPEFINDPSIHRSYLDACVYQFQMHRSGITREDGSFWNEDNESQTGTEWRRRYVRHVLSKHPVGLPGEKFQYASGVNVTVSMGEKVTGQNYNHLMEKYLYTPLGMGKCELIIPNEYRKQGVARGHLRPEGTTNIVASPMNYNNYARHDTAGGIIINIQSLVTWAGMHAVGELQPTPILSRKTMVELHTPQYADSNDDGRHVGGWYNDYDKNGWWIFQPGSLGLGDDSRVYVDPINGLAIAIHCNVLTQHGGSAATTDLLSRIKEPLVRFRVPTDGSMGPQWKRRLKVRY